MGRITKKRDSIALAIHIWSIFMQEMWISGDYIFSFFRQYYNKMCNRKYSEYYLIINTTLLQSGTKWNIYWIFFCDNLVATWPRICQRAGSKCQNIQLLYCYISRKIQVFFNIEKCIECIYHKISLCSHKFHHKVKI